MAEKKKRRTSEQICADLKRERKTMYSQRSKLIRSLKGVDDRLRPGIEKKLVLVNSRIDRHSVKIFKCGKRYAEFKRRRMNLIKRVSKLKQALVANREMGVTERNRKLTEIVNLNMEIRDLSALMGKELVEQKNGVLSFVSDPHTLVTEEMVTIWEVKKRVEGLLQSGKLDFMQVDEDGYPLETNYVSAMFALDDYVAEIAASQRDSKVTTPMVMIRVNMLEGKIEIK